MPKVYSLEWQHGPHSTLFASKGLQMPALRWPLERNPNNRILKKRAAGLGLALCLSFKYVCIIIPAMSKERKKLGLNTLFCQLVLDLHPQQLCISVRKSRWNLCIYFCHTEPCGKKSRCLVSGIFQSLTYIYGDIALRFNCECREKQ